MNQVQNGSGNQLNLRDFYRASEAIRRPGLVLAVRMQQARVAYAVNERSPAHGGASLGYVGLLPVSYGMCV